MTQASKEKPVFADTVVLPVLLALKVPVVIKAQWEQQVLEVKPDHQVWLAQQEDLELKEFLVLQDVLVHPDLMETTVTEEKMVRPVLLDQQDQMAYLEQLAPQELKVAVVPQVFKARTEHQEVAVMVAQKELKDLSDHQEQQVLMDPVVFEDFPEMPVPKVHRVFRVRSERPASKVTEVTVDNRETPVMSEHVVNKD